MATNLCFTDRHIPANWTLSRRAIIWWQSQMTKDMSTAPRPTPPFAVTMWSDTTLSIAMPTTCGSLACTTSASRTNMRTGWEEWRRKMASPPWWRTSASSFPIRSTSCIGAIFSGILWADRTISRDMERQNMATGLRDSPSLTTCSWDATPQRCPMCSGRIPAAMSIMPFLCCSALWGFIGSWAGEQSGATSSALSLSSSL